jgi:hypothetical protein
MMGSRCTDPETDTLLQSQTEVERFGGKMYFYVLNNVKVTDKGCRKGRARV